MWTAAQLSLFAVLRTRVNRMNLPKKTGQGQQNVSGFFVSFLTLCIRSVNGNLSNEMGGACGTYGGGERCAQGFGGET